jgi:hypothetical protein
MDPPTWEKLHNLDKEWRKRKVQKIKSKFEEETEKEITECTFQPKIKQTED